MKYTDNIQQFFDGEMTPESQREMEIALENDPALAEAFAELETFSDLHTESIPAPKDYLFIEGEIQAIQNLIQEAEQETEPEVKDSKIIRFPNFGLNWIQGISTMAAAAAIAIVGSWYFGNQSLPIPAETASFDEPVFNFVETDIDGASSMIFEDEQSGWTIVWIDEPLAEEGKV